MADTQSTPVIRSYRIYLRDAENVLAAGRDVELASDEDARELAARMIEEQATHPCAEVWDRARLVCTVRKEEQTAKPQKRADSQSGSAGIGEGGLTVVYLGHGRQARS